MPEGINDTVIVLIEKNNDPRALKEFRPISLCYCGVEVPCQQTQTGAPAYYFSYSKCVYPGKTNYR
jgi:hypothetical protein